MENINPYQKETEESLNIESQTELLEKELNDKENIKQWLLLAEQIKNNKGQH